MTTVNKILLFLAGLAAVVLGDVKLIQAGLTAFPTGDLMGGAQDFCTAIGLTCAFFHIHLHWNFFGLKIDTGADT